MSSASGDVTTASQAPHQSSKRKVHVHLAAFFATQSLSWRQAQELPWHLMMAGDLEVLLTYLTHSRSVRERWLGGGVRSGCMSGDVSGGWGVNDACMATCRVDGL